MSANSSTVEISPVDRLRHQQGGGAKLPKFFTIDQIADCLNVSTKTVQRSIKSGDLTVHRIGGLVRISDSDLRTFIALRRDA